MQALYRLLRRHCGVQVPPRRCHGTQGSSGGRGGRLGLRRAPCRRLVAASVAAIAQTVPRGLYIKNIDHIFPDTDRR